MVKNSIINRKFRDTSYKNATLKIVILNVLIYLVTAHLYPRATLYLAMIPSLVLRGWVWQFATYMFVHGGFSHLLFNMLSLFIFGSMVEKRVGTKEFLLFYMFVGVLSGVTSFISYYLAGTNVILVGASGALYGMLLIFAVFYPYSVIYIFGILPIRAPILVILYAIIELYSHVFGRGGNIAHLTHLSGLVFGYLYCRIRMRINPLEVFRRTL